MINNPFKQFIHKFLLFFLLISLFSITCGTEEDANESKKEDCQNPKSSCYDPPQYSFAISATSATIQLNNPDTEFISFQLMKDDVDISNEVQISEIEFNITSINTTEVILEINENGSIIALIKGIAHIDTSLNYNDQQIMSNTIAIEVL